MKKNNNVSVWAKKLKDDSNIQRWITFGVVLDANRYTAVCALWICKRLVYYHLVTVIENLTIQEKGSAAHGAYP